MTRRQLGRLLVLSAAFVALMTWTGSAQAALGGPVIIGGDDLTSHGSVDTSTGDLSRGWLYMQRALENISPKVVRANDGSVAALGSAPSTATSGDAGAAIGRAAAKAGLTVTYYEGADAINAFYSSLTATPPGTSPRIIWIAGDDAGNDLDSSEAAALTANATKIADFVNSGGGLMSHGVEYGWLFALLPGLSTVDSGSSGDLYLTPEGLAAFPGVTNADVNAGPWHNYFTGNLGGLQVLVRSNQVSTCDGGEVEATAVQECEDAPVIIGGARVSITDPIDDDPTATPTSCIPPLVGYRCDGKPSGGGGTAATPPPQPTQPTQPTPASTVAGATVVPTSTRVSQPAGVIRAPDTGDGSGTLGGGTSATTLALIGLAGLAMLGLGAKGLRRSR